MRLEQNESSGGQALPCGVPISPVRREMHRGLIPGWIDSWRDVSARRSCGALLAAAIVVLPLVMAIAGSAWAGEGKPMAAKPAAQAHATVKEVKLHKKRRSHARASKSHRRHRSRKYRTQARVAPPKPRVERVHAVRRHSHHVASKPVVETHIAAVPQLPAMPVIPDWPANDKPVAAAVNWNGKELSIDAKNSSLNQILADVSTATGLKVEGQSGDQRVYGTYGPAPARDVLNQLLDGSDYNMVMVGDSGYGTPTELVLSRKVKMVASNRRPGFSAAASDDDGDEDAEQPESSEPVRRRPFATPLQPPQGQQVNPQINPQNPQEQQQQQLQQMQQQLQRRPMPPESPQSEQDPNQ
ncbi:hypothetical protein ACFPT7_24935 [Acidicapsa dinghuensis]|uniref:Secretin/TonB short N-terminal domain-containing protein n=1 Tax=Acidicapsa dinghuensis TaxID=2218256 RepID=A0ABW1ENG9_9BACT|nr:hypothetical protein [Acidicapsa dinghuensis]